MAIRYKSTTFTLTLLFLLLSCGSQKGSEYIGKWESEKSESGGTIVLEIKADGELYEIHKYSLDKDKKLREGKNFPNKKYVAPLVGNLLELSPFDILAYSENDGKLYWNQWIFTKID